MLKRIVVITVTVLLTITVCSKRKAAKESNVQ